MKIGNGDFGDDYLWDRSGPVDPQVERLERLLSPHALRAGLRAPVATGARARRRSALWAMAAMLACVAAGSAWYWQRLQWPEGGGWQTAVVAGQASVDGQPLRSGAAELPLGSVVETGANGVARIEVASIGEALLGGASRLRLVQTRSGRHRVQLDHGTLWARIWAPPGSFGVAVPAGDAYDLGCEFLIRSDAAGNGQLQVRSGWVQFERGGIEVLVPQGAQVELHGQRAPGTPYASDAAPAFVAALRRIDAGQDAQATVGQLLSAARQQDAITLVALLARYPRLRAGPVFDRAAAMLPSGVTRAALVADGARALDPWWRALPYPPMKRWWRQWPDAIPAAGNAQSRLRYDPP